MKVASESSLIGVAKFAKDANSARAIDHRQGPDGQSLSCANNMKWDNWKEKESEKDSFMVESVLVATQDNLTIFQLTGLRKSSNANNCQTSGILIVLARFSHIANGQPAG